MRLYLFLFVAFVLLGQCKSENKKQACIEQFIWLNGSWIMQDDEGITIEKWKTITDSLMEGQSDFIKGDSIIPFETIRMFCSRNEFYYEAKATRQNNEQPVVFKLTSFSDSGFVAENPAHDFPKRIIYKLLKKDSIHAFVDGGITMPEKRADFYYSRKK